MALIEDLNLPAVLIAQHVSNRQFRNGDDCGLWKNYNRAEGLEGVHVRSDLLRYRFNLGIEYLLFSRNASTHNLLSVLSDRFNLGIEYLLFSRSVKGAEEFS